LNWKWIFISNIWTDGRKVITAIRDALTGCCRNYVASVQTKTWFSGINLHAIIKSPFCEMEDEAKQLTRLQHQWFTRFR